MSMGLRTLCSKFSEAMKKASLAAVWCEIAPTLLAASVMPLGQRSQSLAIGGIQQVTSITGLSPKCSRTGPNQACRANIATAWSRARRRLQLLEFVSAPLTTMTASSL